MQESSAAWADGGTGPVKLEGCSIVTPFAAGTCRSMGRSGLSSMLVPGSGTAVLLPLAIVKVCAGGAAPVSGINCVTHAGSAVALLGPAPAADESPLAAGTTGLPGSHLVDNTAPDSQPHSPATPT